MVLNTNNASVLKQCFIDLAKAETIGDYDKALKVSNKILKNFPGEALAFKCKLVALMHLGRFDEALTLIKKTPATHMGECTFEKAYIYYRLNANQNALDLLSQCASQDIRLLELKAQLLYRTERFDETEPILRKLLKNYSDSFDDERHANLVAVIAQLQAEGKNQQPTVHMDTYEQYYNGACHAIECGNYEGALSMVEKAEAMFLQALIEEGLAEEEIGDEISMIRVQKAYLFQKLNRSDEALKIYLRYQDNNPSDKSVLAAVLNNILSSRRELNLLEARKKIKVVSQVDPSKLCVCQRRTILLNQALLFLHSNQREPCRRLLDEVCSKFPPTRESVFVEAALHFKSKDLEKAMDVLKTIPVSKETLFAALQIQLNEGNLDAADKLLKELPVPFENKPSVLQIKLALHLAMNKRAEIEDSKTPFKKFDVKNEDSRKVAEFLQRLHEIKPNDVRVIGRLIKAYSAFDSKRAENLLKKVFVEDNIVNIDVNALERSEWFLYGDRYRPKKEVRQESSETDIISRKRRERKRKLILPKNYDPNVPPDPERWLPRRERAVYRKRYNKKHRDRDIGRGTQGAVSATQAEPAGISKPDNPSKSISNLAMVEGPRQQRPCGFQQIKKKKKKAGSKW